MTDGKDLLVRIDAETTGYERAIARAEAQTKSFEYALRRANAEAKEREAALLRQQQATERLGRGMLVAGGGIALGLGLAAKAAIDWESQWTSVLKVLDGTPEELDAVERGIRDLALELPTTHEELARIAASAGALGIATPNIVEFTRTIAMLGETTNLAGDEGATALARFANIMGTSQDQIDNVAASLVALGNDGASTESEIVDLALRLAAAGKNAGLTEGEVLGLANAMSSLGIEAESGGTAVSQIFQLIDKSASSGGAAVEGFAEVAGVSATKFAEKWETDAAGAFTLFLDGLGRIKSEGGNVYQVLEDLGITGARQIDTLTRLAGANDRVTDSLKTGVREYERNMALTDEFAERNETTEAALQRARNAAVDLAIGLGETLLPIIGKTAEALGTLLEAGGTLPDWAKGTLTTVAALAAGMLILGGSFFWVQGKARSLGQSWIDLQNNGQGMTKTFIASRGAAFALGAAFAAIATQSADSNKELSALATVGSGAALGFAAGGPWGAALVGAIGLLTAFGQANAAAAGEMDSLTETLDEQTGAVTRASHEWALNKLTDEGVPEVAERLGLSIDTVTSAALGNADAMAEVTAATDAAYEAFRKLQEENPTQAIQKPEDVVDADRIIEQIGGINAILEESKGQWRLQQEVAEAAGEEAIAALDGTKVSAYDAEAGVEALTAAFEELNDELAKRGSARAYEAAIDDATKALKENGKTLDINTEKGRANAETLDTIASSALEHAQAVVKDTKSVEAGRKVLQGARDDLYEQARAFGMSKDAAQRYVDQVLKIPREWKTKAELDTAQAKIAAGALKAYIEAMDPTVTVGVQYQPQTYGRRAEGGPIRGPGGPKDDKAGLYALSNGEWVHPTESVNYYGPAFMEAVQTRQFPRGRMADGGQVGGPGQPMLTLSQLLRMLARPEDQTSLREVNELIRARNREEAQLTELLKEQSKARQAVKDAHGDKQKEEAAKRLEKAEKAVADQRSELADATNKWREEQAKLLEQTQAYAATVSTLGDAFGGEGTSLSMQGLLAKKRAAGTAGKEFETYLRVLTRKNLDEDLIRELRAEGPTSAGLALARDLAESGRRQIRRLNEADDRLDRVARSVGTFGTERGGRGGIGTQINNNFNGPVYGDPKKWAREVEDRQRKAHKVARLP